MPAAASVSFKMDGPEFEQGVPILKVIEALREFHSSLDKGYLTLTGKTKLTRYDRAGFKLSATTIRNGSFIAQIDILVPAVQAGLAFVDAGMGVNQVWEVAKNAFEFLKVLAKSRAEGKEPTVQINDSPGAALLVIRGDGNTVNIIAPSAVIQAADKVEPHIKSIARLVDGPHIELFSALDSKEEGIQLRPADNALFNPMTTLEDKPVTLQAKIFRLDVVSRTGKLRILEEEPGHDYGFSIIGHQPLHPYVLALEASSSTLTALREIVQHPSGHVTVAAFNLIAINV